MPDVSLYVQVECDAYSRHRSPQGVYDVTVTDEGSIVHAACAAMQIVKDYAPFIDENVNNVTMRVFSKDGQEIRVPQMFDSEYYEKGCFGGRVCDYPSSITIQ